MAPMTGGITTSGTMGGAINSVFNKSNFSAAGTSQPNKIPQMDNVFGASKATGAQQGQGQTGLGNNQSWANYGLGNSKPVFTTTGTTGPNNQPGIFTPKTGNNTNKGNQGNNASIWA